MSSTQDLLAWTSEALEQRTTMNGAQCRGTVRIALKKTGLDPRTVTIQEMLTVLRRVMPRELELRGIKKGMEICEALAQDLIRAKDELPEPSSKPTDSIMRRIFS